MQAISYAQYGGPDVLEVGERPRPPVAPGEVLIRVRSAAVNPVDWKLMAGYLDGMMQVFFPVVPGWDVAGVVEEVGLDTPEFEPGDEVFAYARKDFVHDGTFAEFCTVPARAVARRPAALSWDAAAALPLAGLTAYQALDRLDLSEDDTVLVHAAAGGVGVLGAQIALACGARVIGTASTGNHEFLRSLGVEPVSYGDGVVQRIRELAPSGVDVAVDFVGGVLDITRGVLAEGGRHGSIADDTVVQAGGHYMWVRPSGTDLQDLAELADAGRLTVPVERTFALDEVAEAFRLSQAGHVRGKLAIRVSG
ncbi:NADP-dependent oxidoreductase [Saccharopolyspora sp. HNM0983]|uniref:NADP-dependent oxidoreductase n=1 Tax=Saccharopolyspora montiporae TaxID=2781240 RepID=A0A929B4C8_9PSEU|nr:NADP-dependent oxidoreductase [Saccharopolyspora sp. HNM0983]MBE9372944.1 NADP-dependent oxidoreductase [Saccharopolyspora sp. HNM0983]